LIEATHLRKRFGSVTVLDDVTVRLAPGTITTLIGPSGSGKSTLLRALALLEPPDSGVIKIDSEEFAFPRTNGNSHPPFPWPKVTVVFQQLFLWPHLTLKENILLPLRKHGDGEAEGRVADLVQDIGIEAFLHRYPNEVSLGQRQLVAIVRALALNPRYLLLDEITSALDVEFVAKVLQLVKKRREAGAGILIITHYIGFARQSADQVLFL
jgi:polar amino acid transport system ATP-binding protein